LSFGDPIDIEKFKRDLSTCAPLTEVIITILPRLYTVTPLIVKGLHFKLTVTNGYETHTSTDEFDGGFNVYSNGICQQKFNHLFTDEKIFFKKEKMNKYPKNLKELTITIDGYNDEIPLNVTYLRVGPYNSTEQYDFSKFNKLVKLEIDFYSSKIINYPPNLTHLKLYGICRNIDLPKSLSHLTIHGEVSFTELPADLTHLTFHGICSVSIKIPIKLKSLVTSLKSNIFEFPYGNELESLAVDELDYHITHNLINFTKLVELSFWRTSHNQEISKHLFPETLKKLTVSYHCKIEIPDFIEELNYL